MKYIVLIAELQSYYKADNTVLIFHFASSKWCSPEFCNHSRQHYLTVNELGTSSSTTQKWHYHCLHHQHNIRRWNEYDTDGLFRDIISFGVAQAIFFIYL